ncbi:MAG: response regulator [Desulfobacteraceae bacterium]|nr:response regulator [Desulfobacteraceae bacterium]
MGKRKHKVLIVDDEKMVSKSLGRILEKMGVDFVSCENDEQGFEQLTKTDFPFSLVMLDQHISGMMGFKFLEQARETSPETIRFLISEYPDTDVLVNAINKGIVQKYIQKPWDIDDLVAKVKGGLIRFRSTLENEKLVRLSKVQVKKLFNLSNDLDEKVNNHKKNVEELDQKIVQLKTEIGKVKGDENATEPFLVETFEEMLKQYNMLEKGSLNSLFNDTLCELFRQFSAIAQNNEFEMPGQID